MAVAEQVDELPRVLLAGDEQHLAHAEPLQELQRVVDHRPAADRQQVLVRDARQLLEPRRGPAGADEALHAARCYGSSVRVVAPGGDEAGDAGDARRRTATHTHIVASP